MNKKTLIGRCTKHHPMIKILLTMKLTIILICFTGLMSSMGSTYAQLTLNLKNVTVKEALTQIEAQSDLAFMYEASNVNVDRVVDIKVDNKPVGFVLDRLFSDKNVSYTVVDKHVVLFPSGQNASAPQSITITGKVTTENGEPIPGVSVVVKGTTTGTTTDVNGNYSLVLPDNAKIIEFSSIGMTPQEITIGAQTVINVVLKEAAVGLDEVVVIGYGTQKKRDVAGSISSVKGTELSKSGSGNAIQALSGRASGVFVVSETGKPGSGASVRIRGIGGINNSEPLYVIDGVQGANISEINPNDIQSMEVLKDASSSAIYGARGANGVVLVTTKRGEKGKPKISYSSSFGVQNMMNPSNIRLLNAREYAETINKGWTAAGLGPVFGGTNTATYPAQYFPAPSQLGEGTNYIDEMMIENAPIQEHNLSVSGGNDNLKAFLSFGYLNQDGILKFTGYQRYTFRFNAEYKVNNWLSIGDNTSLTHGIQRGGGGNPGQNSDISYIFQQAPTIPLYNEDGTFAGPPTSFYFPDRNVYAKAANVDTKNKSNSTNNNLYIQLKPVSGLTVKSEFVVSAGNYTNDYFYNGIYREGVVSGSQTTLTNATGSSLYYMWSNTVNYNKTLGEHSINLLGGYEVGEGSSSGLNGQAYYNDPSIKVVGTDGAISASINQSKVESSTISQFGRFAYNYKSKYYFTANVRRDGSSKFGSNNHFGVFPSYSGAYRISAEDFFPKTFVSDLKLRASYGEVGNDKIGDYAFIAPVGSVLYSMNGQNGSFNNGLTITSIANPDLKWETSKQMNFGIDVSLFKNSLTLTADYFKTDVSDMLLGVAIPATSGISDTWWGQYAYLTTNLGKLTNKGFEFEAKYQGTLKDLSYGLSANITTFNNEITDIGDNPYLQGNVSRTYVGGSLGDFYGYVCEGIFQTQAEVDAANALDGKADAYYQYKETAPGDFKFADLNGDKIVNDKDRKVIGSPVPKFIYGFGLDLAYKQFSLTALFNGSHGNKIYNALRANNFEGTDNVSNRSSTVLNGWDGPGTSNTIPRRYPTDANQNSRTSTNYVEDGSYLRLRNIVFSYSLPKSIIQKLTFENASVFLSGDNLFTFTKYKGFDPEVSISKGGNNLDSGYDFSFYPHAITIRFGLKLTL